MGRAGADIRLVGTRRDGFRQHLELEVSASGISRLSLALAGEFQVENALTAAGLAIAAGEEAGGRDRRSRLP